MVGRVLIRAIVLAGAAKLARLIALFAMLASNCVFAEVIDAIDVARVGDQAEVTIRFATEIQYLRHVPENSGKFLRIFFRVTKPGFSESDVMQEVRRLPKNNLVPPITFAYPELVNGMLVTFSTATQFTVRAGDDSRSIVIMVPLPPEKRIVVPIADATQAAAVEAAPEPVLRENVGLPVQPVPPEKKKAKKAIVPTPGPAPVAVSKPAVVPVVAESAAATGFAAVQTPDIAKPESAPMLSTEKIEEMAHAFLLDGREAFDRGDYVKTINRMNRILSLPGNAQTEAAQALLGEAREKNGEIAKARAEYDLFLKLYPNSPEAARIRQHLAQLPAADTVRRPSSRLLRDDRPAEWMVIAGLSSYFFTGQSKQDDGPMKRDQESLVSSLNLSARLRDGVTDTRFVFRDTDSRNYMQPSRNYNRVYSAYAERSDRDVGYFVRAGRQNPNGAGVMERFDGITASFNLNPDFKVGAVYGDAVEFGSLFNKKFYGINVELAPQVARPGASLYWIEQKIDGYLNRRAVGSDIRYFDGQFTGYGMIDYDLLYKGVNIGMAQGNYMDKWGNNYFMSYDYRKSPSYSLTNALMTTGYTTIGDFVDAVGAQQARQMVSDTTSVAKMFATGVTIPVGERLQLGFDYRMSEISGTSATIPLAQMCKELQDDANPSDPLCVDGPRGTLRVSEMGICQTDSYDVITRTCKATSDASGRTNMYSAQAIATSLFVPNGVGVAYLGWIDGPNYSGQNLGLSYVYPFVENWRLEGNARYYTQKSDSGQKSTQFSPSMKLVHQWGNSLSLEAEVGYSDSKNSGSTSSKNTREYLYMGMRWDYR